eukprot:13492198-Alexandrium_andersonii.AAC.1
MPRPPSRRSAAPPDARSKRTPRESGSAGLPTGRSPRRSGKRAGSMAPRAAGAAGPVRLTRGGG